jgi:hypothetical protein
MTPAVIVLVPVVVLAVVMVFAFAGCADVAGIEDVSYAPAKPPGSDGGGPPPPPPPPPPHGASGQTGQYTTLPVGVSLTFPAYPDLIVGEGPLHYWRLRDPTGALKAADSAPIKIPGTYSLGGVRLQVAVGVGKDITTAAEFDGVSGVVDVVPLDITTAPQQAFTVEAWVQPSFPITGAMVVLGSYDPKRQTGFVLDVASVGGQNVARARLYAPGTATVLAVPLGPATVIGPRHLAMTYQPIGPPTGTVYSGTLTLFVDGTQRDQKANVKYDANKTKPLSIGAGNDEVNVNAAPHQLFFKGPIAEVALYPKDISAQLSYHFTIGTMT